MNWRRMNIKKNFIPITVGALIILTIGTLFKSYKGNPLEAEVEKEDYTS